MRRLFIIRKDLHLTPGKLAAMVGHCCEAYWMNLLKQYDQGISSTKYDCHECKVLIPENIWDKYITDIFTKTICECKNLNQLKKAEEKAKELKLTEGWDYGYINDCCKTELVPENPDGTTTIGIWFGPLEDDIAHEISKKYILYGKFDKQ